MTEPTDKDLSRDLAADLLGCAAATQGPWFYPIPNCKTIESVGAVRKGVTRAVAKSLLSFKSSDQCEADARMIAASREGWPAAIVRAQAAEAFKAWVHAWLDGAGVPHDPEPEHTAQHGCRISGRMRFLLSRATTAEADLAETQQWLSESDAAADRAEARVKELEAIVNAPAVALFADGREPTQNERHLLSLLSWREKEAAEAKAEAQRLQGIIEGLADRVAAQSELLSCKAEGTP